MSEINLTHAAFSTAIADVAEGSDRLRRDRDRIDLRVRGFLGRGWTGVAADSFVEAWDDWKLAADDVLEGLTAMGVLLEAVYRDFVATDEASQQALDSISARIVDRLGPT
ncbi:MAG: hypothetical protein JWN84_2896 [Nocardioides sp.]|nr:hypothetical protein [Nocardioides sp.]